MKWKSTQRKKEGRAKQSKNPARIEVREGGYQFKFLEGMNSR